MGPSTNTRPSSNPSKNHPKIHKVYSFVLSILEDFFSVILTISTATHMIICCLMSSMYRDTVLTMIRCGYVPKPRKPENSLTVD
ncbi:hypothetical protein L5515_006793 [Caenorhabditis briggsae]|uniref:Uncharacterized protein n=1 Tax=Caenorhabditis briggsae TaxID=6238 RepID=A0AAE9F3E4_CAEBR|nr:hypothetical protein L5515_006793 [Caenorhabditis briggsae]